MSACLKCSLPLKEGAKFCPKCGAAAQRLDVGRMPLLSDSPPPLAIVKCGKCGGDHKHGAKFCPKCGTPVKVGQSVLAATQQARTGCHPFLNALVSGVLALIGRKIADSILGGGSSSEMNFMYVVSVFGVALAAARSAAKSATRNRHA